MVDRDRTEGRPVPGDTLGPWVVLERLDAGSFGTTYRCKRAGHPAAGDFCLKLARNPKDPRFEREGELLQLGLPGQPKYEDQGCWTGPNGHRYPYVVMQLVKGLTLYDWFGRGRTSREVLRVLAQVAGEAADRSIDPIMSPELAAAVGGPSSDGADDEPTPSSSTDSTRAGRRRRRQDVEPDWLAPALVALSGGLVFALVLLLAFLLTRASEPATRWEDHHQEVARFAPDAGVGDEALASAQNVPRAVMPLVLTVGAPIPKEPHQGQKRPPCGPGQIAVNGGCWAGPIEGQRPPCGHGMFEHEDRCYFAIYYAPRQPTSDQP